MAVTSVLLATKIFTNKMRALLQRVSHAQVCVAGQQIAAIQKGILILIGIEELDTQDDINWLCSKIVNLRIFNDENGKMNISVKEMNGEIIVVSQFTLHAETSKGNRPSYIKAARPEIAIPLYEAFKTQITKELGKEIGCGKFGADMQVTLCNDGPVSIWIDTKNKS